MKALELLKKQREEKNIELSKIVTHGIHTENILDEILEYDKAIDELEELIQSNISCSGCVYHQNEKYYGTCERCIRFGSLFKEDYFKAKEEDETGN